MYGGAGCSMRPVSIPLPFRDGCQAVSFVAASSQPAAQLPRLAVACGEGLSVYCLRQSAPAGTLSLVPHQQARPRPSPERTALDRLACSDLGWESAMLFIQ